MVFGKAGIKLKQIYSEPDRRKK